jgi:hypothetical protein
LLQDKMGGADLCCGEDRQERGSVAGGFDVGAAALFTIDEAEDSGDGHAGFARGFDGGDGGASGGADVVDDDYVRAFFEEAFDLASGAVGLFCLADEKAVDEGGSGVFVVALFVIKLKFIGELQDFVVVGEGPGAGGGDVGDQGVGAHGEPADGFGLRDVLTDEVVKDEAGETAAFGVESGDATVDVVVGLLAAGQGEVAELEGEGGDEVEESGAIVDFRIRHDWLDCNGGERWLPPLPLNCAKSSLQVV